MKRLVLTKTKTDDEDLQDVQDNIAAAFRALGQISPIIDGRLVTANFSQDPTITGFQRASVSHGLGRAYAGFLLVSSPSPAGIFLTAPWVSATSATDRLLELRAFIGDESFTPITTPVTATFWIF